MTQQEKKEQCCKKQKELQDKNKLEALKLLQRIQNSISCVHTTKLAIKELYE